MSPRLLTEEQAAEYLNVPRAEINRRGIGRIRLGIRTRYDRLALDAWVDAQRSDGSTLAADEEETPEAALERIVERERHAARRS